MRVTMAVKHKTPHALKIVMERASEQAVRQMLDVARFALTAATRYTPKWSGEATEGWTLSFEKPLRVGSASLDAHMASDYDHVVFPEGIVDLGADTLNRAVVAQAMRQVFLGSLARSRSGKPVSIYLSNTVPHAALWLTGDEATASKVLRAQNQDYYTYADIRDAVKAYRSRQGKKGRFY